MTLFFFVTTVNFEIEYFLDEENEDADIWGIPREIEPDFRIFCTTICDFDETWSIGFF